MTLDYRNTNTLWASVAVETLARLGLTTAVVCPGSRSTPLTVALARHPQIEAIPILDERSAAFFAVGCAKRSHQPVVLVCTSGTAGANFYPAVIEAQESRVPLVVLTADRPPELRDCASGQTIDQQKLFGSFVNWYAEVAIPEAKIEQLAYLRQTVVQGWVRSHFPTPGPVHFNCPFRDPLSPLPEATAETAVKTLADSLNEALFFATVSPPARGVPQLTPDQIPWQTWQGSAHQSTHGVIIAGPANPQHPETYCQAVACLSHHLGWPVLAEALSPLRNYAHLNPNLITTYDSLLHQPDPVPTPDCVIQLGPLPTSKSLRQWLAAIQPPRWIVDPHPANLDPLHGPANYLHTTVECLIESLTQSAACTGVACNAATPPSPLTALNQTRLTTLNQTLTATDHLFEGKAAWLLSQHLPPETPIFIANSMPIRDMESVWQPNDRCYQPYFSRGANGIDGTLSTAMGMAHRNRSSVLLTGDLAFLHDTNGLLNLPHFRGHLTIVLINNQGGGIFEMLPIAKFEPPFETYFATPQAVDIATLCTAYGVSYVQIKDWEQFVDCVQVLPDSGVRLLEVGCDRKQDAQWRKTYLVRDLSVNYRHTWAVEQVSFTLQPGQVTGLLGPNG
ncbi:MAG: 2-succinyl-5-enolpyruvyl-6-hydroxy-3-cyclohexene-1-carboxylic-acid synthase, partial [Cyanobacteria bacterium P01_A01_bin.114]